MDPRPGAPVITPKNFPGFDKKKKDKKEKAKKDKK